MSVDTLGEIRAEGTDRVDADALAQFLAAASTEAGHQFPDGDTYTARDGFAAIVGQVLSGIFATAQGMPPEMAGMVLTDVALDATGGVDAWRELTGPMSWGYVIADLADLILRDPFDNIPTRD